jgi:hypothetical protein
MCFSHTQLRFLGDRAENLHLVVHRDADYLTAPKIEKYEKRLEKADLHAFVTEFSDIEGYFLNAKHLAHVNPAITEQRVNELILEATVEMKEESVKSIVNLRAQEAFLDRREGGAHPNLGDIAVAATNDYDGSPETMRRGKLTLGILVGKLQKELKQNPKVFVSSPHLVSTKLAAVSKKIWD